MARKLQSWERARRERERKAKAEKKIYDRTTREMIRLRAGVEGLMTRGLSAAESDVASQIRADQRKRLGEASFALAKAIDLRGGR